MNEWPEDDAMFDDRDDLVWLERLLDGADAIRREDAPASCAGLADVLLAAWAPASPDDFAGEAAVRAMFRSLAAGERAERTPFARRAKAIAVAASLGATAMTGVAAAAGRLPPDVQDMASQLLDRIGIHVPAAERREMPLEVPAGVSSGVGAGAAVAPTGGLPGPRTHMGSGFVNPSAGPVDVVTEPATLTAVPDVPQEATIDDLAASAPPTDALAPVPDVTTPVTAPDAAAGPSTQGPAADAIPASAGGSSDAPASADAPAAPAAPVEEPTQAADHGQQAAPGADPARPDSIGVGRGHAGAPAGPPAGVPADPPASPPAGPPADVPGAGHASPPAGPPADVPASHGAPPSTTPGRPDGVGTPAAAADPPGPPARP